LSSYYSKVKAMNRRLVVFRSFIAINMRLEPGEGGREVDGIGSVMLVSKKEHSKRRRGCSMRCRNLQSWRYW